MSTPTNDASSAIEELANDAVLAPFLQDDFDPLQFAGVQIRAGTVTACLDRLGGGIDLVDKELHSQVIGKHEELLEQVIAVRQFRRYLSSVSTGVAQLQGIVQKLHSRLVEPFVQIQSQTRQLTRLQDACDTLRRVGRVLSLTNRLRQIMPEGAYSHMDIVAAARVLADIDSVLRDSRGGNLDGIDVVDAERNLVSQTHREALGQAEERLMHGLETQSLTDLSLSVQSFYSLGDSEGLSAKISGLLSSSVNRVRHAARVALDSSTLRRDAKAPTVPASTSRAGLVQRMGGVPTPSDGEAKLWKNVLMDRMTTIFGLFSDTTLEMWALQRVLVGRQDQNHGQAFVDIIRPHVPKGQWIALEFWHQACDELCVELGKAPQFSQDMLVHELPSLLRLAAHMVHRLVTVTTVHGLLPLVPPIDEDDATVDRKHASERLWTVLRAALVASLEPPYLAACLNRLQAPIHHEEAVGNILSLQDGRAFAAGIKREIQAVKDETSLCVSVCKSINNACGILLAHVDDTSPQTGEVQNVSGPSTAAQKITARLINALTPIIAALEDVDGIDLDDTRNRLVQRCVVLLLPWMGAIERSCDAIIATMHTNQVEDDGECSEYMASLTSNIKRFSRQHFSLIQPSIVITSSIAHFVRRVAQTFTTHAVLLSRSETESGRAGLVTDIAQFESIIMPVLDSVDGSLNIDGTTSIIEDGIKEIVLAKKWIRAVRSLRTLLFLDPVAVADAVANHDDAIAGQLSALPLYLLVNHLIVRGPSEMKSVHSIQGWSPSQYVRWLDVHSEDEALGLVNKAIDAYARTIDKRGDSQYSPVYTAIRSIMAQ